MTNFFIKNVDTHLKCVQNDLCSLSERSTVKIEITCTPLESKRKYHLLFLSQFMSVLFEYDLDIYKQE